MELYYFIWYGYFFNCSSLFSSALPKATLTVTPNPVYHGETVSLKCSVESGPAWSYRWYKDGTEIRVEQSGRHRISGDSLTISKVESYDQGSYRCRGELRSLFSTDSDSTYLYVYGELCEFLKVKIRLCSYFVCMIIIWELNQANIITWCLLENLVFITKPVF